jgi:hypothetical protein
MRSFLFFVFFLSFFQLKAQKFPMHPEEMPVNDGKAILLNLALGGQKLGGDLGERFGTAGTLGGGLEFLTASNFILGAEGQFYFGNLVKEDPLDILRTPEGDIIGNNRAIASVVLRQRGFYTGMLVGKLFAFGPQRSGIRLTVGAGYTQHWIRIQDDTQSVTQLTGDYKKGYDRRTGGLALNEFIGWQHLSRSRRSNWILGFEFNQGFTKTLRDWDFSEMRKLDGKRLDLRFGLKAVWTLPFYPGKADKIYY